MDTSKARERLIEELENLESLLEQRRETDDLDESQQESTGALSSYDQHPGDTATTTFQRSRDLSVEEHLEERIDEVEAALSRIEEGTYGKCEVCGERIEDERLAAVPATRYCKEHREEVEEEAAAS